MAVVMGLKHGSCRDHHLAFLLRELTLIAITNHFTFTAIHIPGSNNTLADALSRFNFQAFFAAAPDADSISSPLPPGALHYLLFPPWIKAGSTC